MLRKYQTFSQVLNNCDDQVKVREMLELFMTHAQKKLIVDMWNKHAEDWNRRAAESEKEAK